MARSTFPSQNVQNTPLSDHFWKLRCRKSARRCGAKHISKSTMYKTHQGFGPLLEVEMSKKCTPLWREAHFEVNICKKTRGSDHFWRFEMSKKCTPLARSTFVKMHQGSDHFWRFGCRKSARRFEAHFQVKMLKTQGVRTTFGGSDVAVASLHYTDITLHYTPVHYITLHYAPVHSTTLNYTTPHYITLNDTATQIDR